MTIRKKITGKYRGRVVSRKITGGMAQKLRRACRVGKLAGAGTILDIMPAELEPIHDKVTRTYTKVQRLADGAIRLPSTGALTVVPVSGGLKITIKENDGVVEYFAEEGRGGKILVKNVQHARLRQPSQ
jgi:CBS domain-containing protein